MKKPPSQVAPPQSRFRSRQAKVTTQQDPDKLDQLKALLPHYLERYHTDRITKRSPHKLTLHCPFHEDRSPSFTADDSKGTWLFKCFSCGRAGSLIDLHAEIALLKPRTAEALQSTAQAVGMELPQSPALTHAERKQWALKRREAERSHAEQQKKAKQQKLLTDHQQRTLSDKLKPYLSTDWRADLWHSSPLWTETPNDSTLVFLSTLFPPDALLWMGEPYDTGQEKHRSHFKTCQEWLKVTPLPPRLAAGCFRADSYSRSIVNLESSS
ncbi:CHC2 zinc finger domain-containing protein, partial [bacterium]|nr:CHC2 zinc finger domain-containing protein [bacterium]